MALAFILASGPGRAARGAAAPGGAVLPDGLAAEAFALLNAERGRRGLPDLAGDSRLSRAALAHAREMRDRGYTAHESPVLFHRTPGARLAAAGVPELAWGENVGHLGRASLHADWEALLRELSAALLASPDHRRNWLDPRFTHAGIGLAAGAGGADRAPGVRLPVLWIAQVFVRRRLELARPRARAVPGGLEVVFTGGRHARDVVRLEAAGPDGTVRELRAPAGTPRFTLSVILEGPGAWTLVLSAGGERTAAFRADAGGRADEAVSALGDPE